MSSQKPKLLLFGPIDHAMSTWEALSPKYELTTSAAKDRAAFLDECRAGTHDGVIAAFRTFKSVAQTGRWDQELVDALPSSFRFVAHNGAGYDQLDPPALQSRKILASNVPTAVDDATADTALFLLLGALRNFFPGMAALRRGTWQGSPAPALGHDPAGKLLGVLGMGGIGRNLAAKARALGMAVAYHNRNELSADLAAGAEYLGFEELLRRADVLFISVPLNPKTRHLIGKKEFEGMKDGVVVINTARGAVVDEAALVDALESGKVASAGLDVYEEEPKVHPGLVKNERCVLVPHMGTYTVETQRKMEEWAIGNVENAADAVGGDRGKWREVSVIPELHALRDEVLKG